MEGCMVCGPPTAISVELCSLEGNIGQKNWCRLRRVVGLICRLEVTICVCTCACVFLCKPSCRTVSAFYFQSQDILAGPQNFKELFYILANRNLKLMMIFQMMCNHRSTNSYTEDVGHNPKREKQFCSLWIQISHCHWLQYFSDFIDLNYIVAHNYRSLKWNILVWTAYV